MVVAEGRENQTSFTVIENIEGVRKCKQIHCPQTGAVRRRVSKSSQGLQGNRNGSD